MTEPRTGFGPGRPAVMIEGSISIADATAVAEGRASPMLTPEVAERISAAHERLQRCIGDNRLVYGITTGFGPLANRITAPEDIESLQRNLIYHLATGVGDLADWRAARMIVLARLSSIAQGVSGASPDLVARLISLLDSPFAPCIPMKGTVGASGDLTPLSHFALALMGEGGFIVCNTVSEATSLPLQSMKPPSPISAKAKCESGVRS
ncbi:MAG: aromatic amino acid lyase, partial [Pseudomonadota bacterium]